MAETKRTPDIRFQGFCEDWIKKELGNYVENIGTGKSSFNASKEKTEDKPYAILGSRDVIGYDESHDYSGNFILTARVGENAGRLYRYAGDVKITDNTVYIKSQNLDFIFYLLYKFNLRKLSFGTGQPLIKSSELQNLELLISEKQREQSKIGSYFQNLDNLITQHQKKYDKLKNIKKAMLEKMFPQAGADEPEIRFKGFSGKWEEKKLGEVVDIVGGGTPSTSIPEYWDGDIDWYSPTEIGKEAFANSSVKKITNLGLNKSSAKILPANRTILFTSRAGIGDMAILTKEGATNQGFQSFILGDSVNTYFLYSAGGIITNYALKHASGSTFLEISSKQLSRMNILIPNINEQSKIGEYFYNLDKLIKLNQQEIEKLKNIKKAMLEKMFV